MNRQAKVSSSLRWIALAVAFCAASAAQAATLEPGSEVVLQGTVDEVVNRDSFWLATEGERVLVYQRISPRRLVISGQSVRIHGRVSDDWMRLADTEVDARRIESNLTAMR